MRGKGAMHEDKDRGGAENIGEREGGRRGYENKDREVAENR